jgi:DNA ligase (NAD+)
MSESFATETEFTAAVADVLAAAAAYYHDDRLVMADADYDLLVDRIEASVAVNPDWDDRGVLTQVAASTAGSGDVVHAVPMLSLAKATTAKELSVFLSRIGKTVTVTEPKLDGMAVSVRYLNGELTQAATRGDGATGEDVTAQAQAISGLPVVVDGFTGEVRGEVFMTRTDFDASNASRVADGGEMFKNPRNAVAGSLRKVGTRSRMSFAAYDVLGVDEDSYSARLDVIESLGFQTARSLIPVDSTDDPQTVIALIETLRPTLDFDIDGAVVKVDSEMARDRIGVASRHPKWALAWKYAAEETRSVLRDIEVTVGRTGRVAFTAVIDPVDIAGSTVGKATLHNADFIATHRLGIGSDVLVSKANDVIPRVVGLDTDNNATIAPYSPPTVCQQCEEPFDTSEVNWRCHSAECSIVGSVTYFASREAMDIDGLGEVVAEALVSTQLVSNVADLYDLTVNDFATLELSEGRVLGEKNAVKIVNALNESKAQPFNRVVTSLGIRKTGRTMGRRLAAHFTTMDKLMSATIADLTSVEGVASEKARHIRDGLTANANIIDRLAAAGVNMGSQQSADMGDLPLAGKTVVVTGAMSGSLAGKSRNEMNELIEAAGGKASGSVSKATSFLVCGEEGSSKYVKAQSLGVRIVTPEEFAEMVS